MFKRFRSKHSSKPNQVKNSSLEKPLWDYLDLCKIDFRESKSKLIAKYGSRNCGWTDNLDYCEFDRTESFLENLAHPIAFQFDPRGALDTYPTYLFSYIRASEDPNENLAIAHRQLTALLGQGAKKNSSISKGYAWQFGEAEIDITIYRRELNSSHNSRHEKIPGSMTECSIGIETAFYPPPTQEEFNIFESLYLTKRNPKTSHKFSDEKPLRTKRALTIEIPTLPIGHFSLDRSGQNLVQIINARSFHILPTAWVKEVLYVSMKPATGGGSINLTVVYQSPAQEKSIFSTDPYMSNSRIQDHSSISLIEAKYSENKYFDVAKKLADDLGVPLHRIDDYDM